MRFGMAMAAIIPMIATTMRSSISEKPSCRLFLIASAPSRNRFLSSPPLIDFHVPRSTISYSSTQQDPCQEHALKNRGKYGNIGPKYGPVTDSVSFKDKLL